MTKKSAPQKVVKNMEKPKSRSKCEVIRHFDPSVNYAACRTNLKAEIPHINIDDYEDPKIPKNRKTFQSRVKNSNIHAEPPNFGNILKHNITQKRNLGDSRLLHQPSHQVEQKSVKRPFTRFIKSSSSSSLESGLEKLTRKSRIQSKPFYPTLPKTLLGDKRVKSARDQRSASQLKYGSLKSLTDPMLVPKSPNLQAIKQEIRQNRKSTSTKLHKYTPNYLLKNCSEVEGLKSEILQSKANDNLEKRILITEIRSEIAQYKQFSNFLVYNTLDEELNQKTENDHGKNPKKNQNRRSSDLKHVAIMDERNNVNDGLMFQRLDLTKNNDGNKDLHGISIEKDWTSAADTTDILSDSTLEEYGISFVKSKGYHEPNCYLNDNVIRNKIQEANQLIDRVKKALDKIKAVKSRNQSEDGESSVSKSGSSDIEETLKTLKRETALLITDDNTRAPLITNIEEPKSKYSPKTEKKSDQRRESANNEIRNKMFVRQRSNSGTCNEDADPLIPIDLDGAIQFESLEDARLKFDGYSDRYHISKEGIGLERPKTRRSETDDLSDQKCSDKFRNCPDLGHLQITSSIEELQAKLQTISENSESNISTPRMKTTEPLMDQISKYCNTDPPRTENKGIQTKQDLKNVEVACSYLGYHKYVQTNPIITLTQSVRVESISPRPVSLEVNNIPPQELPPIEMKCTRCLEELRLPIIELLPPSQKYVCKSCKEKLTEEHLVGISTPSKPEKLRNLKIQVLPPIVIQRGLTLTEVLNLSINPEGECENRVKNVQNVLFVQISSASDDAELQNILNYDLKETGLDCSSEALNFESSLDKYQNDNEIVLQEFTNDEPFRAVKTEKASYRKLGKESDLSPKNSTPEEEAEQNRRMLCYKSFHIFDNPNRHDPGELEHLDKLSVIDANFYKTFINPNTNLSEERFLPYGSKANILGFESRMVQCDESMLPPPEDVDINRYYVSPRVDFARKEYDVDEGLEDAFTRSLPSRRKEVNGRQSHDAEDSQITVLHVKGIKPQMDTLQSSTLFRQKKSEFGAGEPDSYESTSEITVTVSYISSSSSCESDKRLGNLSHRSISELHESEIKTTNFDNYAESCESYLRKTDPDIGIATEDIKQEKLLTVVDSTAMIKLHEKLKCVDTTASNPSFIMPDDIAHDETIKNFLKELTNIKEKEPEPLRVSFLESPENQDSQLPKMSKEAEKESVDTVLSIGESSSAVRKESEPNKPNAKFPKNHPTVNYLFNKEQTTFENSYVRHLELGKNDSHKNTEVPRHMTKLKDTKPGLFEHRDKEIARDKVPTIPRHRLKRYSPETSNSDTVTTNSISEGEILCKHSVSNGEIHICRDRPQRPRLPRDIRNRRDFSLSPNHRVPHNLTGPKKFDLNDPKVTIEQRRNYFNNWVTYYICQQDIYESSTSSSNNNNKQ